MRLQQSHRFGVIASIAVVPAKICNGSGAITSVDLLLLFTCGIPLLRCRRRLETARRAHNKGDEQQGSLAGHCGNPFSQFAGTGCEL